VKKSLIALIVTTSLAAAAAWYLFSGRGYSLDLSAAQLQERIAQKFPIRECYLLVVCLDLQEPKVILTEGSDKLGISARANINIAGQDKVLESAVEFYGKLRYDPTATAFYLDDLEARQLQVTGVPEMYAARIAEFVPLMLRKRLAAQPIYTLRDSIQHEALARMALQDIRVENGKLRLMLGVPKRK
jgi:Protein of unknown function (DUF1439)